MKYEWIKYPILVLPPEVADVVAKSDLFIKNYYYPRRSIKWFEKHIKDGEIGIYCGYRIVLNV